MVLLVLVVFLVYIVSTIYDFNFTLHGGKPGAQVTYQDNVGIAAANTVFYMLSWFCSLVGITIGCSVISSERMGNTLNTLIVKPVYRDTIINGKLLGSLGFLAGIMAVLTAVFTLGFFLFCGDIFVSFLSDYFARLPFVFVFALVNVAMFLTFSMLLSIIVRDQAFAMILSVLAVYISEIVTYRTISSTLNNIIPGFGFDKLLPGLSPSGILLKVQPLLMDPQVGAYDAFLNSLPDLIILLIYAVIAMVLSYIVFVRRDIS
jgi:ABC-2 type transport system permease protein